MILESSRPLTYAYRRTPCIARLQLSAFPADELYLSFRTYGLPRSDPGGVTMTERTGCAWTGRCGLCREPWFASSDKTHGNSPQAKLIRLEERRKTRRVCRAVVRHEG